MRKRRVLITGGAGFIGVNAARRLLADGWDVSVWDNLSRRGAEQNLEWLRTFGPIKFTRIDLRQEAAVNECFQQERYDLVLHCAAQVGVTTSLANPRFDLENNVLATFNLLEAVRLFRPEAFLIFASSNKVYGAMDQAQIVERDGRYELADFPHGVSETQPIDFHSPYGCSKGAADQYVRDYSRTYSLATTCFRQSCIYGYRQFGIEDQGWVAWFLIAHALRRPITIFGDGKQTRDLLFIDDLIDAYRLAWLKREKAAGQIYNVGGGPQNQFSLKQLRHWLESADGRPVDFGFAPARAGDQKVFVADIRKASADLGWRPSCPPEVGIRKLNQWVNANLDLFRDVPVTPPARVYAHAIASTPSGFSRASPGALISVGSKKPSY